MILARLKESTRDQHEALEGVVDVMNQTFSIADYRELLSKFYRFYSAIEPCLPVAGLKGNGFDIEPRRKTPLLERDLTELGVLADVRALPAWSDVPDTESVPAAFGAIYVMEGATLGGQVISRHLKEQLGLTPENGGAFFNSYGREVGPMWKAFGAAVTAFADKHPETSDTIVDSARQTFDCFRRCFIDTRTTAA
jgi:heme oxygenase (biliverdin-IX-beta and delta-forming)